MSPIGAIGFELWTMQPMILFDNIYLGTNELEAEAFANESWKVKYDREIQVEDAERPSSPQPDKV